MTRHHRNYPSCFGRLDIVFPKEKSGLRQTPPACLSCTRKIECLRSAMAGTEGLQVREEVVDRAYSSGIISFWERWSKKKDLKRRIAESAPKGVKISEND